MIRLNERTRKDFLSAELCKKLIEAGMETKDAKYFIGNPGLDDGYDYVVDESEAIAFNYKDYFCPTYTLSDLLMKLDEWPGNEISLPGNNKGFMQSLTFYKEEPFYVFGYNIERMENDHMKVGLIPEWTFKRATPIEAAAELLLKCIKEGIHYNEDISNK